MERNKKWHSEKGLNFEMRRKQYFKANVKLKTDTAKNL